MPTAMQNVIVNCSSPVDVFLVSRVPSSRLHPFPSETLYPWRNHSWCRIIKLQEKGLTIASIHMHHNMFDTKASEHYTQSAQTKENKKAIVLTITWSTLLFQRQMPYTKLARSNSVTYVRLGEMKCRLS